MDLAQLAQVEILCKALYQGANQVERNEAQQQLLTLTTSAEYIPQCQFILDNSELFFAQVVASTSLENLVTQFWNNFTLEQKVDLRNYVLNYLATRAHLLQDFAVGSLTKLSCRITKLGWFDSPEHREIVGEVTKFLEATVSHHVIGLKLLNALVEEMNTPTSGRTLTLHRKTAVSFRDYSLFQIFQVSITTLQQILRGNMSTLSLDEINKMSTLALNLSCSCLSFDFIGTNPEESAEDVGTVQVPSSWRPVVQDTSTIELFFDFYLRTDPPQSVMALQSLVHLSSIRRSLFPSEKERSDFLQALMTGIRGIMQSKKGLNHLDNNHEFCRLLGRLKASYQLSELVKTKGFLEWLELACAFTIESLHNWQRSMNSIHYLLALWGRLVAAIPYLRTEGSDTQRMAQILRQCVLQMCEAYIKTMLDSVDVVVASDGDVEDPLDDEGSLKEQMDRLPVIARLQYDTVAQGLVTLLEQGLGMYQEVLSLDGNMNPAVGQRIQTLEGRLTWLTHMVAAIISSQTSADTRKGNSDLLWDGRLCRYIFQLAQFVEFRLSNSAGKLRSSENLELALMTFFRGFKKTFVLDGLSTPTISMAPGSSPAHPLLSLALSSPDGASEEKDSMEPTTIYDAMAFGDSSHIMNIVVNKLCNNIKYWNNNSKVLEETLDVFVDLVSTYSSSKTLLGLDSVNFLVHNHVGAHFPFLGYDTNSNNKYRITFYSALSRLVFSSSEDLNNSFDAFIVPNLAIIAQLSQTPDLRTQAAKSGIIGAMRDLRGIAMSTFNKRTYNLLFDSLYPDSFPLLTRITNTWFDDPEVMTAVLKFIQEITSNKGQRIVFEQSSANGILLFRETSEIICSYGSRILSLPVQRDIYVEKYKGIRLMLNSLICALSGNYVNFGVFSLYNDQALQNALDVSLQLCLQIPLADILAYVKLSRAYFGFLEVLFRNHLDVLSGLDSTIFLQLVKSNLEGLQSAGKNYILFIINFHVLLLIWHFNLYMYIFLLFIFRINDMRSVCECGGQPRHIYILKPDERQAYCESHPSAYSIRAGRVASAYEYSI